MTEEGKNSPAENSGGVPAAQITPKKMAFPINNVQENGSAAANQSAAQQTPEGAGAPQPAAAPAPPSNLGGVWAFIKAIFVKQENEQDRKSVV